MHRYSYEGPVTSFGQLIMRHWASTTYAVSKEKALSNFRYQWTKMNKKLATTRIELPGQIKMVEG